MLFGGYEHDPVARWLDGVPWDHSGQTVPADEARFAPLMQGAARRFPFLADAGVVKLVCHPDAMTPDGNPLVGRAAGRARLLRRGRPLAQRLRRGGRDRQGRGRARDRRARASSTCSPTGPGASAPCTATRSTPPRTRARPTATTTACATRSTATCWAGPGARARCTSACRTPAPSSPAKNGWERADYCRPGQPWRRAGEDQRAFGWAEPPLLRRPGRGVRGAARARGPDRHDVVRQDRRRGPGCGRAARARVRRARRPQPGQRRLHAVPERARRHRRRRHRHAPRASSASASSPAPRRSTPTSAGCACTCARATTHVELRDETDDALRDRHVGPARARRAAGRDARTTCPPRPSRSAAGAMLSVGGGERLGAAHHLRRRARI